MDSCRPVPGHWIETMTTVCHHRSLEEMETDIENMSKTIWVGLTQEDGDDNEMRDGFRLVVKMNLHC